MAVVAVGRWDGVRVRAGDGVAVVPFRRPVLAPVAVRAPAYPPSVPRAVRPPSPPSVLHFGPLALTSCPLRLLVSSWAEDPGSGLSVPVVSVSRTVDGGDVVSVEVLRLAGDRGLSDVAEVEAHVKVLLSRLLSPGDLPALLGFVLLARRSALLGCAVLALRPHARLLSPEDLLSAARAAVASSVLGD